MSIRSFSLLLLSGFLFISCTDKEENFAEMSVEELYNRAIDRFDKGAYVKSAKAFAEVERQHPYSNWAVKAQLMSAFSYYQAKKYDDAIEGFRVFVQLHPSHEQVPYAYYMIGMCYYEQIPTTQRDQKPTVESQNAFKEVVERYSQSPYAKDAKYKLDLIQDHLASKEMEVARYYLDQGTHLAALNRYKSIVETYQTTSYIPEALHRMVECYLSLGIREQAEAAAAVLGHNYPDNKWYKASYALLNSSKK